jgi:serine/threonine protein kinase
VQGSFGQVVHAHDSLERRDVAIKVIKNNPHFARQARQEIEILQLLNKHDPDDEEHIGMRPCLTRGVSIAIAVLGYMPLALYHVHALRRM